MKHAGGFNYYGIPIGVISLESYFPKPIGHIKNPLTFDFPVIYETVVGASVDRLVNQTDLTLLEPFISAARKLEREGVKAITGSCGFLALFQREIAESVQVPVFVSSLIQIPLVSRMLGSSRSVGVVVANSSGLTSRHLEAMGITNEPIVVRGMESSGHFLSVILKGESNDLDFDIFRKDLFAVIEGMLVSDPNIGALVLECTDLSHFSKDVQTYFQLPVFDLSSLTKMVASTVAGQLYR